MSLSIEWGKEELQKFREQGFLLFRQAVEPERCDAIREIAEIHLKYRIPPLEMESEYIGIDKEEYRETVRRLRQVYDRDILFRQWMQEPAIRPLLAELLGEMPVLVTAHHNSIMTKMPRSSTPTHWHRDERYWRYRDERLLSVWLALGRETEENGVLEFIPGSHRQEFSPESFDERDFFRDDYAPNRPWIENRARFTLEKGDLVLFHCRLLHRAGANRSEVPKISFVYTVKAVGNEPIPGTRSALFPEYPLPPVTPEIKSE
jgi:phytanoyl-CoA hydroxylase